MSRFFTFLLLASALAMHSIWARLSGNSSRHQRRQLWSGSNGEACTNPPPPMVDPNQSFTATDCRKCQNGSHVGAGGKYCGPEEPRLGDGVQCNPNNGECSKCANGYHQYDEDSKSYCGPWCGRAGKVLSWFDAHKCCKGHTVGFFHITCN